MTGYEKSPDYGGPALTWRSFVVPALCAVVVIAAIGLAIFA